jgi:hypothetical protein
MCKKTKLQEASQIALLTKYFYSDQTRVEKLTDDVLQKGEMIRSNEMLTTKPWRNRSSGRFKHR